MKKHPYLAALAAAGTLMTAIPFMAYAQDTDRPMPPTRQQNLENNREIRNVIAVKARMASTTDAKRAMRPLPPLKVPAWVTASSSPWGERREGVTVGDLKRMVPPAFVARFASTTEIRGHEKWKEAKLEIFAKLQANVIAQTEHALAQLRDARAKIAARIEKAASAGRDMTEAKAKLVIADAKILVADTAIKALASYVPPVLTGSTVSTSTAVTLEKPRQIGKTAIEALKDAKKALQETIRAIAHNMGLKTGQDGRIIPQVATTTTATTTP